MADQTIREHGSILVVDDEPLVSEVLQEFFADQGYAVDVAATGHEAFRRASSKRPDAVILDMGLPDTTGDQLLTRLRTLDDSMQIVMLTGRLDAAAVHPSVATGAVQYLHKPFDFEVIHRVVARAVETGRERLAASRPPAR